MYNPDRTEMLRVKLKSLAAESRIIRFEKKRVGIGALETELHWHRVGPVREEARATHIAYGLIKGHSLNRIETSTTRTDTLWKKVKGMIEKYGPVDKARRTALLEVCK